MQFYVAFSIHGTNCFITANKDFDVPFKDGFVTLDGFIFEKGHSRVGNNLGATKLLWGGLKGAKGKPLTDAKEVLMAFNRLREKGWVIDDRAFIGKHKLEKFVEGLKESPSTKDEPISDSPAVVGEKSVVEKARPAKKTKKQSEPLPPVGSVDDGTQAGNEAERGLIKAHEESLSKPETKEEPERGVVLVHGLKKEDAVGTLYGKDHDVKRYRLRVVRGDISKISADVIVNAANAQMIPGGGVDGALNRAAGPNLEKAMRETGGCPTGSAVSTLAYDLPARFVVHAVGPIYKDYTPETAKSLLSNAYGKAFDKAAVLHAETITCPLLSTGVYGYPIQEACEIAVEQAVYFLTQKVHQKSEITFVAFDDAMMAIMAPLVDKAAI